MVKTHLRNMIAVPEVISSVIGVHTMAKIATDKLKLSPR